MADRRYGRDDDWRGMNDRDRRDRDMSGMSGGGGERERGWGGVDRDEDWSRGSGRIDDWGDIGRRGYAGDRDRGRGSFGGRGGYGGEHDTSRYYREPRYGEHGAMYDSGSWDRDRERGRDSQMSQGQARGGQGSMSEDAWGGGMGQSRERMWGSHMGQGREQGTSTSEFFAQEERESRPQQWGQGGSQWYQPSDTHYGSVPNFVDQAGYQSYAHGDQMGQGQGGSQGGQMGQAGRHQDPEYHALRSRHIEQLDRDYDEFRRHRQDKLAGEFEQWRRQRAEQRGNVSPSEIQPHMAVVGSDDKHVGTVDHMEGGRIKLERKDPSAGGKHHFIELDQVQSISEGRLWLKQTADEARRNWETEGGQGQGQDRGQSSMH